MVCILCYYNVYLARYSAEVSEEDDVRLLTSPCILSLRPHLSKLSFVYPKEKKTFSLFQLDHWSIPLIAIVMADSMKSNFKYFGTISTDLKTAPKKSLQTVNAR